MSSPCSSSASRVTGARGAAGVGGEAGRSTAAPSPSRWVPVLLDIAMLGFLFVMRHGRGKQAYTGPFFGPTYAARGSTVCPLCVEFYLAD
jgi:hypothetical protein